MYDRIFSLLSAFLFVVVGRLLSFITLENIKSNWGLIELGLYFLLSIVIQGIISYMRVCLLKWSYRRKASKEVSNMQTMSVEELIKLIKTPIL